MAGLEGTVHVETTLTAAEKGKTSKDLYVFLFLTVGKAGGAPANPIRKFKPQTLTSGDGERVWLLLMNRCKYGSGEIVRTTMDKFINLKIKDGKDLDTFFF